MADSDRNWELWGERDPYFAVLTDARYRRDNIEEARSEFFASGRDYIDDTFGRLERYFGPLARRRALDFGCGVGRLTLALTRHFAEVTGVDIAPAMLEEARANSAGLPIDYQLSDDGLTRVEGQYDFVNSCIVLQHIPVDRGMPLIDAMLSRVTPGGGCAIHLSLQRRQGAGGRLRYFINHHVPGGQAMFNLLRRRPLDAPVMQMNEYPLPDVLRLFNERGFLDLLVRYQDHDGFDTVLILGRRSTD